MAVTPSSASENAGSAFDSLFQLWMLPTQIGVGFVESSLALMRDARPAAHEATDQSDERTQQIARAAEEQAAHIDDGAPTIPTPAGLIA